MAHPLGLQTKRQVEDGFQLFTIVQSRAAVKLPDSMRCAEGAKLPLGILTASAALYNQEHLRLPLPDSHAETAGITLLIWGGSSNVGIAAIQLARASGVEVVTVASERNWEVVREAGAAAVVDQNDPDVVNKVAKTLQSKTIIGAFDGKRSDDSSKQTRADGERSNRQRRSHTKYGGGLGQTWRWKASLCVQQVRGHRPDG